MTPAQCKAVRKKLGTTQTELAKALGVTQVTVAYWETGKRPILKLTTLAIEHLTCKRRNGK